MTGTPLTLPSARAESLRRCSADVVYWLTRYGWTCDQRRNGPPVRFRPYPRQVEFLRWLEERERLAEPEEGRGDGLVEKSRDMGVTWLCCAFAVHRWLFRPGYAAGFGSRKLELVDNKGNPDCIFEKIRFLVANLPAWMTPPGFKKHDHDQEAKLINPSNGATVTGEGGQEIGRGGRKMIYFVDEKGHLPHADKADRALSYTTRCQIDVGTPNGMGNNFQKKRHSGRVPVFVFDWKDDPRKSRTETLPDGRLVYPWEEVQKKTFDAVTLAQEVYRDYTASVEGICIPAAWVRAAVGLGLDGFEAHPAEAGLDVGAEGPDETALATRRGPVVGPLCCWGRANTTQTAWRARDEAHARGVVGLAYEHAGVGAGVKGTWDSAEDSQRPRFAARPVNTGAPPTDDLWPDGKKSKDKFLNLRAELWWKARCRFEKAYEFAEFGVQHPPGEMISIPNDPELVTQLSMPLVQNTATGKLKVESKKDMKARGVKSPNRADALVLAFCDAGGSVYHTRGLLVVGAAGEGDERPKLVPADGPLWVNPDRDDWLEDD